MEQEKAIARAYGGEPVVVRVLVADAKSAVVRVEGAEPERTTGWPLRDLFEYDEKLVGELRRTYVRKDTKTLYQEWERAKPYPPKVRR